MIFEPQAICTPLFCTELNGEHEARLKAAPFTAVLVSSGRAAVSANSAPQLLAAGGLLLAREAVHIVPVGTCHIVAVGFGGAAAKAAAESLAEPLASDCDACPMAGQLLGEIAVHYEKGQAAQLSALSYRALCSVAAADTAAPVLPPLVARAVVAMRENYGGLYGVEELSAQLEVSKSHLVRVFSAAIGVPPGQYLTKVRVEAAKQLLQHRAYTLDVVASLCGFSGANYLCKVFKKLEGQTPAAYRAAYADASLAPKASEMESALYV